MNSAKVQSYIDNGCFFKNCTFELEYPQNLFGIIDTHEFNETVTTLNSKISSKIPGTFFIFLIPIFIGILVMIGGMGSYLLWFGVVITSVSSLSLLINILFFHGVIEEKIIEELRSVNKYFKDREVTWGLESEIIYTPVDPFNLEFNVNKEFLKSLEFDERGFPYHTTKVMYLLITFPAIENPQLVNNINIIDIQENYEFQPQSQFQISQSQSQSQLPYGNSLSFSSLNNSSTTNLSISMSNIIN
ncbi:hypothetical protein DICPUDRAFT_76266 [Dictyostelium purpureum]|uniref:Uncharacterized protein n=1 Tax=Dictyostelium purpureum TaxID=5786 RepID=F0ZD37_DICPU|nr:uncharacterized protein DICPUDRAFT_76266 [Dictyostelium purpureum]EGC38113.1 hypothetical protein DICPUDRAFT_76266 [Dictyostelium purpureum]|eukprot:XP_003285327.1 hypothetical protein DICPUDRAFT_76266 [Dictyostelium purpureum]